MSWTDLHQSDICLRAGQPTIPHCHSQPQNFTVLQGSVVLLLTGRLLMYGPGDSFTVAALVPFALDTVPGVPECQIQSHFHQDDTNCRLPTLYSFICTQSCLYWRLAGVVPFVFNLSIDVTPTSPALFLQGLVQSPGSLTLVLRDRQQSLISLISTHHPQTQQPCCALCQTEFRADDIIYMLVDLNVYPSGERDAIALLNACPNPLAQRLAQYLELYGQRDAECFQSVLTALRQDTELCRPEWLVAVSQQLEAYQPLLLVEHIRQEQPLHCGLRVLSHCLQALQNFLRD